jgi:hypothetical protein
MSHPPSPEHGSPANFPAGSRLWVTLLWVLLTAVVFIAANAVGLLGFAGWHAAAHPGTPLSLRGLVRNGSAVAISTAISAPLLIGYFVFAARLSTQDWAAYLGLRWPSARQWGVAAAAGLGLLLLDAGYETFFSDPRAADFMESTFRTARSDGTLVVLVAAVMVLGPVSEEIAFRGFFHARLAPRLGVPAAILLTAAAWSGLHLQYGWSSLAEILVMGLTFGGLRWYTNSIVPTILMHCLWNGLGLVQVAWQIGHN